MANFSIASVEKKDVQEISANKKPVHIIQLIFDVILILFNRRICVSIKPFELSFSGRKVSHRFFEPSSSH